jgi:transposase-like protein
MKSNGTSQERRQFAPTTKQQILQEGRTTNTPLSPVCEQYAISPTLFYQWERIAAQAALAAFAGQQRGRKKPRPSEEQLLAEVQRLREVIAELSSENPSTSSGQALQLKKRRWS